MTVINPPKRKLAKRTYVHCGEWQKRQLCTEKLIYCYRDTTDTDGEARAASGLGEVYLQMGEFDKAMHYHQMAYDISENHEDMDGKVFFL